MDAEKQLPYAFKNFCIEVSNSDIMKDDVKQKEKKKISGRPKGSKSGIPFTSFPEAMEHAKNIWEKAQYNEVSFKEISSFMKVHEKKAVRILNALQDFYGVVEKTPSNNWRLTDAGKRLVKNDSLALKEVFTKNPMFAELYNNFGNKQVTEGVILDYIRKKYKYVDVEEVKRRLMEGLEIIKKGSQQKHQEHADVSIKQDSILPLFQLRYALKPATREEIEALAIKVEKILEDSGDDTLKLLAELMQEKRKDHGELANLLDKAMKKLKIDYSEEKEDTKKVHAHSE